MPGETGVFKLKENEIKEKDRSSRNEKRKEGKGKEKGKDDRNGSV